MKRLTLILIAALLAAMTYGQERYLGQRTDTSDDGVTTVRKLYLNRFAVDYGDGSLQYTFHLIKDVIEGGETTTYDVYWTEHLYKEETITYQGQTYTAQQVYNALLGDTGDPAAIDNSSIAVFRRDKDNLSR